MPDGPAGRARSPLHGDRAHADGGPGEQSTGRAPSATPEPRRNRFAASSERPRLPRVAGLDGFRGVMLVAVLAFHHGLDAARGGFLAISSFGTLSGFLIATLLLAEWARSGSIGLARFLERRARRLLPTVLAVIGLVVALQTTLRVGSGSAFRGDVLAALAQALNWRYAFGGAGFTGIFTEPSPVQHLWAVGMHVQVAIVFPLIFVGLMTLARRHWRLTGIAFGLLAVASFAGAWLTSGRAGNDGLAFYGTHVRVGEVLVGVVLAYGVLSPTFRRVVESQRGTLVVRLGAVASLVGLAVLWHFTSLHDDRLFGGITALNALLTAWIVLAVTTPGPVGKALGTPVLRTVGEISFAAFVIHWPVYLVLDGDRIGLPSLALLGVRIAVSLVLAFGVTRLLERPFRESLALSRPALGGGLATVAVLIAVAVIVLPQQPPHNVSMAIDNGREAGALDVVVPEGGTEVATIALVGDGLASSVVSGFATWNSDQVDEQVRVHTHLADGCGLASAGPIRLAGETVGEDLVCLGWGPRLPKLLDAANADAIVVIGGAGEIGSREIDRQWRNAGDPIYDDWLADQLDELADRLAAPGVPVIWATQPHVRLRPAAGVEGDWTDLHENDPARVDRLNELIKHTVSGRKDFALVDLDAWAHGLPGGEFGAANRAEGRDLTPEGADRAVAWLVPEVLSATGTGGGDADGG